MSELTASNKQAVQQAKEALERHLQEIQDKKRHGTLVCEMNVIQGGVCSNEVIFTIRDRLKG